MKKGNLADHDPSSDLYHGDKRSSNYKQDVKAHKKNIRFCEQTFLGRAGRVHSFVFRVAAKTVKLHFEQLYLFTITKKVFHEIQKIEETSTPTYHGFLLYRLHWSYLDTYWARTTLFR